MRTRLRKTGDHHTVAIPDAMVRERGLKEWVDITVLDDAIMIRPTPNPRAGWEESVLADPDVGDDEFADWKALPNTFDEDEWTW